MPRTCVRLLLAAAFLGLASAAGAWPIVPAGSGGPFDALNDALVLPGGDVVIAVGVQSLARVSRLAGADGSEVWHRDGLAGALALDGAGDIVVAGGALSVAKLAAADGSTVWQTSTLGQFVGSPTARGVAVDAAGDVAVAAEIPLGSFGILKLAGSDGSELWRASLPRGMFSEFALGVAFDAAGAVLAQGTFLGGQGVAKFDGTTGAELWRVSGPSFTAVDAAGDFYDGAATSAGPAAVVANGAVAKHSGTDGSLLWQTDAGLARLASADGTVVWQRPSPFAGAVSLDGAGDVLVAGAVAQGFTVAKVSGADGSDVWQTTLRVPGRPVGFADIAAADATGDVFAFGDVRSIFGREPYVTKLEASGGAVVACGNGTLDAGEQCDDGNRIAGDGCEADCVPTLCANGVVIAEPRLKVRRTVSGIEIIALKGDLPFAAGTLPGYDPATSGAQIHIEDLGRTENDLELSRRTIAIPGMPAGVCGPRDGWKVRATSVKPVATYRNTSTAIDPPTCTPSSAAGLRVFKATDERALHGRIRFAVQTKGSTFTGFNPGGPIVGPITGPIRVTVVLGGGTLESAGGYCGTYTFDASQCFTPRGFSCQ